MPIMINKLPPITKSTRDIVKSPPVPGRDGFLTQDFETYQGTVKPCECTLLDITMVDQLPAWLDGSGEVIFSNQPDRKYQACIINQISFSRINRKWYKFIVMFDCQPLPLMLDSPVITLTVPGNITNAGTHSSKPVIKIYGTGTVDLSINGNVIHLTNVVGYVTIDSGLMDSYKDTLLKNNDMIGEFPELIVGENTISWTGAVTKVEITPNWRFLG